MMKGNGVGAVRRDIAISLVFILTGGLAIININSGGQSRITEAAALEASTLPTIYGALLIILAAIILIGAIRKLIVSKNETEPDRIDDACLKTKTLISPAVIRYRTLGALALLIVYAVLLTTVNFIVLTAGFLATLFFLFGRRNPIRNGVVAILGSAGFYLLFIYFLNLPI